MQKTGAKNRIGIDKELYLIKSTLTAAQTVARLKHILEEKYIPINFVINHAQDAASVGLVLRPTFTVFAGSAFAGSAGGGGAVTASHFGMGG